MKKWGSLTVFLGLILCGCCCTRPVSEKRAMIQPVEARETVAPGGTKTTFEMTDAEAMNEANNFLAHVMDPWFSREQEELDFKFRMKWVKWTPIETRR